MMQSKQGYHAHNRMALRKLVSLCTLVSLLSLSGWSQHPADEPSMAPGQSARVMGTISDISTNGLTIKTDAGSVVSIQLADGAKILETAPGQKTLAGARPVSLDSLKVGDRVLAHGASSAGVFSASVLVAMRQSDIAQRQQAEQLAWQQRSVSGVVKAIDPVAGTIGLQVSSFAGNQLVTIAVSKQTSLLRYTPGSARFADAKPGTLDEIHAGDQLRALGQRSEDGSQLTAEQIISGKFRNIAATMISFDPATSTLTTLDLGTKKPVTVKITLDSTVRALPAMMAQRLAMRFKGNGGATTSPNDGNAASQSDSHGPGQPSRFGGARRNFDLQQMLTRMPPLDPKELEKGQALMIVATDGSQSGSAPSAITVLSGVEPILSAAPTSNDAAMLLSPWNLGGGQAGAADSSGGP